MYGARELFTCIIRYNYLLLTLSKLFTLSICNIFYIKEPPLLFQYMYLVMFTIANGPSVLLD